MRFPLLAFTLAASAAIAGETSPAQVNARLMRMPAVSATQIAFVYAGDIWMAPKEGGAAFRLSSPRGAEQFPRFSPDGSLLAFSANYEGNTDIYVMPVTGGEPRRLTHHGAAERLLGWYPDGQSLLMSSNAASFTQRVGQLYRVPLAGGLAEQLPMPYGEFGAIAPDGKSIAYTTITTDFATWKRYRGGMTPDIWHFDLEKKTAENLTQNEANDSQPMWHGSTLYFLSDRGAGERENLWAWDSATKQTRQVTHFTDADVLFPSIGPADIVFENSGRLILLDLATEKHRAVEISVVTDRATLRPRVENVSGYVQRGAVSPTGKRVLFEARGEIFSVPAEHGVTRNVTDTSGVAERYPAWSPDGKWIAYFSDRTGEYELTIRPADGKGDEQTLTQLGPGYRYQPWWSPDARKVAFIDHAMRVHLHDLDAKTTTPIDRQLWLYHGELERFRMAWSADSRWLTYAGDTENRQTGIVLYDTHEKKRHLATSGYYDDDQPSFDPEGKYLYYRSKRWFDALYSEFEPSWIYANSQALVAVPLRRDVPSPTAPRNDEEPLRKEPPAKVEPAAETAADAEIALEQARPSDPPKPAEKPEEKKPAAPAPPRPVAIDLDGFESRGVILPPGGGRFDHVWGAAGKVIFVREPRIGSNTNTRPLSFYDLEKREEKLIVDDAGSVRLSDDGKKLLVSRGRAWSVINVAEAQKLDKQLATGALEASIDPPAEWRQLFADAWRIQRDFFYDPGMHGVDWAAMRTRYGALLADAATRWDVNYVLGEMLGELNVSHAYRRGGDTDEPAARSVGYLGCDFTLEQGAYRIARILEVAPWDLNTRSPLRNARVNQGDWLLAVNGRRIDTAKDPWAAFQGLADRAVMLTVNDKPAMDGAREVLVQTMGDDSWLRQYAWIEANRRRVEEASGGQIGYVYVRSTAVDGQNELYRQFRAQFTKPGLIIDERWNSGGQIPDRFVELLQRRATNFWGVRDGRDWQTPQIAHNGPKAILANAWSGSGGDCFPWLFKKAGLGPIIGTRTWGGLIGITGAPPLIDGGSVTVPTFSIYDAASEWIIEGRGVEPDIAVVDDPAQLAAGVDPQLERAIAEVKKSLEQNPGGAPKRPAYPNRAVRGL